MLSQTHPKEFFQVPSPHTGPSMSKTWQDTAQQHIPHQDLDLYPALVSAVPSFPSLCTSP